MKRWRRRLFFWIFEFKCTQNTSGTSACGPNKRGAKLAFVPFTLDNGFRWKISFLSGLYILAALRAAPVVVSDVLLCGGDKGARWKETKDSVIWCCLYYIHNNSEMINFSIKNMFIYSREIWQTAIWISRHKDMIPTAKATSSCHPSDLDNDIPSLWCWFEWHISVVCSCFSILRCDLINWFKLKHFIVCTSTQKQATSDMSACSSTPIGSQLSRWWMPLSIFQN